MPELLVLECASAAVWERWLEEHHATSNGVWLQMARKGLTPATVTHAEALELAICFGWIDGQRRLNDERTFQQRFTPRTPKSKWSQINRDKALQLIERGQMRPAGRAQVTAAQQDGRWDAAYEPQSKATVPPDLQQALDANPEAAAFFATLTGVRRYAFLYRLHNVKTAKGRARRIAGYIEKLSAGDTLN